MFDKSDPVSVDPHIGMSPRHSDFIFLRAGIGNIQTVKDIDGGNQPSLQPNYGSRTENKKRDDRLCFTNRGKTNNQLLDSHVISLRLSIFKVKKNITPEQQTN